ncbi:MAG: hypothetical protein WD066_04810 [Planctomycetaceae bacterium]
MKKPQPNHREYIRVLWRMTSAERIQRAMDLSDAVRAMFRPGLRRRFPNFSEEEFHRLYLERLAKCHNRNY